MKVQINPNEIDYKLIFDEETEFVKVLEFRQRSLNFSLKYWQDKLTEYENKVSSNSKLILSTGRTEHEKNIEALIKIKEDVYSDSRELYDIILEIRVKNRFINNIKERLEHQIQKYKELEKLATDSNIKTLISNAEKLLAKKIHHELAEQIKEYIARYNEGDLLKPDKVAFYVNLTSLINRCLNYLK